MSLLTEQDKLAISELIKKLFNDTDCGISVQVDAGAQLQNLLATLRSTEAQLAAAQSQVKVLREAVAEQETRYAGMEEALAQVSAELKAYQDPEWQLVPKEPTSAMVKASHGLAGTTSPDRFGHRQLISITYHAMLAAAPQKGQP